MDNFKSICELKGEIKQLLSPPIDSKINIYYSDADMTIHRIKKLSELYDRLQDHGGNKIVTLHAKIIPKCTKKGRRDQNIQFLPFLAKQQNLFKDDCDICKKCQGLGQLTQI